MLWSFEYETGKIELKKEDDILMTFDLSEIIPNWSRLEKNKMTEYFYDTKHMLTVNTLYQKSTSNLKDKMKLIWERIKRDNS